MMRSLLWKDFRLNTLIWRIGLALGILPYLGAVALAMLRDGPSWPGTMFWSAVLTQAALLSLAGSELTLTLLGGNVIACERADRSAEFLAYLPPSRAQVLGSKALVSLGAAALIWVPNLLIADLLAPALHDGSVDIAALQQASLRWGLAATGILLFGAGWLGSALLDSPAVAVGFGFGLWIAVIASFAASTNTLGWPTAERVAAWYAASSAVLGALCIGIGSCLYLRRIEP
jgi:ABC-type transport system involved in multi-copper enzyme maturation permease subunit